MEAAAAVAAARGGALPMSSSSRKEWRAVSDHHLVRNHGDELVISFLMNIFAFWHYLSSERMLDSERKFLLFGSYEQVKNSYRV